MIRVFIFAAALCVPARAYAGHVHRAERLVTPQSGAAGVEVMAEEALVRFNDPADMDAARRGLEAAGMQLVTKVGAGPWHLVYLPEGMPTATGLDLLHGLPGVSEAHPNHAYRVVRYPGDPLVASQWHLGSVNAFSAWEYETGAGNNNVIIAVMDTGVDATHPDLAASFAGAPASQDCSSGACQATCKYCVPADTTAEPVAACYHGTRVAGAAAASTDNGTGVAGMSWGAKLVSLKIFKDSTCNMDCSPQATCIATDAAIIAAIDYARTTLTGGGRRVIVNMSIGGGGACAGIAGLQAAVTNAVNANVVLVAASGNTPYCSAGADSVNNPGNCTGVIPVGSTDQDGNVSAFSCGGPSLATRGLVAPGRGIYTTDVGSGYAFDSGTSFASPIVAGVAALIVANKFAAWAAAAAGAIPADVSRILRSSTFNVGTSAVQAEGVHPLGNSTGAGQLNAYSAMRLAVTGSTQFDGTQKAIAFPNPFKVATHRTVSITVPSSLQAANISIKLYTTAGQLVRTLQGLSWDGKNDEGNPVATGTYIFLVSTDNGTTTGRLALIR